MTMRRVAAIGAAALGAVALAGVAPARADDGALAAPTLVPAQAVAVAVALEGRLDGDAADVAADAWYGVGAGLTLGLRHSQRSVDAIGAGRGLCLRGCRAGDDRYRGVALTARFPLAARLTGELATDVTAWSPAHAAVTVGVIADWRDGRRWARATARLAVGLLGRADGNRDRAAVDATVGAPLIGPLGVEVGALQDHHVAAVAAPALEVARGDLREAILGSGDGALAQIALRLGRHPPGVVEEATHDGQPDQQGEDCRLHGVSACRPGTSPAGAPGRSPSRRRRSTGIRSARGARCPRSSPP